jgi:hypothetical protein
MLVVSEVLQSQEQARSHPWDVTSYADGGGAYYNFVERPELIPKVLEDFLPFAGRPAVRRFYQLLWDLNAADAPFESNDCALLEPVANTNALFRYALEASGRLEIFYREQHINTHRDSVLWLSRMLQLYLQLTDAGFDKAVVTITAAPTEYAFVTDPYGPGYRLRLTFHAYGNDEDEVWDSLDRVFAGMAQAIERAAEGTRVETPAFP